MGDNLERFTNSKRWSDKFITAQLLIVASLWPDRTARLGTLPEDWQGADVLLDNGTRIGLRSRHHQYANFGDIAIRLTRNAIDGRNELDKIKAGRIDYSLNCFATESASHPDAHDDADIERWEVIDLAAVRKAANNMFVHVHYDVRTAANGDKFLLLNVADLERNYGPAVLAAGTAGTVSKSVAG